MKRTIALDLDGVLADYSMGWKGLEHIGNPLPGAVEFVKELSTFADVLIFTTRCCEDMGRGLGKSMLKKIVQEWLDKHGFVYGDIYIGQGKPIFSAVIDDRAVSCRPADGDKNTGYANAITRAKELCGEAEKKDKVD